VNAPSRFLDRDAVRDHLAGDAALSAFRTPESEIALLSAMLRAPDAVEPYTDLQPIAFADPVNAQVWRIGVELILADKPVSPALIRDAFGADRSFGQWGGIERLMDLADTGSSLGIADHAAAVKDRALRRAVKGVLNTASDELTDLSAASAIDVLGRLEQGCANIARHGGAEAHFRDAGDIVADAIEDLMSRTGEIEFPFGLRDVDNLTGGMRAGETTILGAWTGMGKTIAGLQVAKANAMAGKGSCYFSLEMSETPMGIRMACDLAFERAAPSYFGVTSNATIDGALKSNLKPHQWQRLRDAQQLIRHWPLLMDTRAGLTVQQIEAAARRAHRKWERMGIAPGPVIIDHIGKVRTTKDRRGDKTAEMTDVSNDLAEMAKRLGVPVVPMSQMNRDVQRQVSGDKRPRLEHLKQASAIAEDARQVIMLYRPEYEHRAPMEHEDVLKKEERLEQLQKVRNHFYWIVEKNSSGPRDQALTFCEAACSAVRDW
jgi:replicative DNA helicase